MLMNRKESGQVGILAIIFMAFVFGAVIAGFCVGPMYLDSLIIKAKGG